MKYFIECFEWFLQAVGSSEFDQFRPLGSLRNYLRWQVFAFDYTYLNIIIRFKTNTLIKQMQEQIMIQINYHKRYYSSLCKFSPSFRIILFKYIKDKLRIMSELRQKEMINQLKYPFGYFKVFIQQLKITSHQQFKPNERIKINVSLDKVKKQSKIYQIKGSMIEICKNFVFVGSLDSKIGFDLINCGAQKNNLAHCSFSIQKFYAIERVRHNVQIDLIAQKNQQGSSSKVKVAELKVQLLHINSNIGMLELKIINIALKEELPKDSQPILQINDQKHNLQLSKNNYVKQFENKIIEPEIIKEIYFKNIQTQVSIKYSEGDYDSNNKLKCQCNLNLIADDYLCPFEDEWIRPVALVRKTKKNQQIGTMLISTQFFIDWEKQFKVPDRLL